MGKLLLIEQTNMLQIRLSTLFNNMGYKEIIAFDGNNTLSFDKFYKSNNDFDDIIIDLDQFRNIYESIIASINESLSDSEPNITVLTDNINYSETVALYSNGIDNIIIKPFNDELIIEKLSRKRSHIDNNRNLRVRKKIKGDERILKWCSTYEIGIEEIDHEHKNIIDHFQKLYELMKVGKGHEYKKELIIFLEDYVETHFQHEEKLQSEINYFDIENHKRMHQDFKVQIEKLTVQLDNDNSSNSELIKLNLYIKNWISDHILIEDKKIANFIKEK